MRNLIANAHGKGASALARVERPKIDDLQPLNVDDTDRGLALAERRGRPFEAGNSAASGRKPALCSLGVPIEATDPRYRSAMRKANAYRQRRVREVAVMFAGRLGAGPCAMLAAAARALAASIVLNTLAGEALASGATDDATKLFLAAARLGDSSKQQELTAVALAEREHEAMKGRNVPGDPLAGFYGDEQAGGEP